MQALKQLRRGLLLCGFLTHVAGCATSQFQVLKQQMVDQEARHREKERQLQVQIERLKVSLDVELQRISSRVECHNDRVREFLKECEAGTEVCSEQGLANAFQFMITQPYVTIYLKPSAGIKGLVATRKGQLVTMGDPKNWLPSTRFLILVQPRGDNAQMYEEAQRLGREVQRYLAGDLFADEKGIKILGPKIMPCKMKAEEVANHIRRLDTPVKGEPFGRDPSVRIWVFRTDC